MAKVHPIISAISRHRGEIVACISLVDSIMYVAVVKGDLLRQLRKDPKKCNEMSVDVPYDSTGPMYIDRGFGQINRKGE